MLGYPRICFFMTSGQLYSYKKHDFAQNKYRATIWILDLLQRSRVFSRSLLLITSQNSLDRIVSHVYRFSHLQQREWSCCDWSRVKHFCPGKKKYLFSSHRTKSWNTVTKLKPCTLNNVESSPTHVDYVNLRTIYV